jgi:hypothetical protein
MSKSFKYIRKLQNFRSGSVAVMMIGIFVALIILFVGFLHFSTSRQYSTKRLNRILLAREFSSALATLTCDQLQQRELKNNSSKLLKGLSFPMNLMPATQQQNFEFDNSLETVIDRLKASNSELQDVTYKINWEIRKKDFVNLSSAYPREKMGFIRIPIAVSYKKPASNESITENYLYIINIKVVANLVPVLSKFTLYIKNALSGEDSERFNLVQNDRNGNLIVDNKFRPWVLNNGCVNEPFPGKFSDAVKSCRGLVYLGGGELKLSLARSFEPASRYAEGFQLRDEGRDTGFVTIDQIGQTLYVIQIEAGLAFPDINDANDMAWHNLIAGGYDKMAETSSLLKLFGTQAERSPTLVFGKVKSRTLAARVFKDTNGGYSNPLPVIATEEHYENAHSGVADVDDISHFYNERVAALGSLSRDEYNEQYASALIENPYNRALGFIASNYNEKWPLNGNSIDAPLKKFVSDEAIQSGLANKIPEPFNTIYGNVSNLSSLSEMLANLKIAEKRSSVKISLEENEKLLEAFSNLELFKGDMLDLNCWVYLKSENTVTIDQSVRLVSHGGIVLEKGDIRIANRIKSQTGKHFLTLITLDGNIIIDSSIGQELDLSLIAAGTNPDKGQVKFEGSINSQLPVINGNVVMQRLNDLENNAARGVKINYRPDLAALPQQMSPDTSEKPLLMYRLEYPRLVH